MTTLYLAPFYDDVCDGAVLCGSEAQRLAKAKELHREHPEFVFVCVDVSASGRPEVYAYPPADLSGQPERPKLYLVPTYAGRADDAEGPFFDEDARLRRARHLHGKIEDGVYYRLDVYRHIAPYMQAYSNGALEGEEAA